MGESTHIPIKTDSWNVKEAGFVEVDLVSHSGNYGDGEFIHSLNMTDIQTGWVETRAVLGKGQVGIVAAMEQMRQSLPFPLRGIDSDNGSEFINYHVCGADMREAHCAPGFLDQGEIDCHRERSRWGLSAMRRTRRERRDWKTDRGAVKGLQTTVCCANHHRASGSLLGGKSLIAPARIVRARPHSTGPPLSARDNRSAFDCREDLLWFGTAALRVSMSAVAR